MNTRDSKEYYLAFVSIVFGIFIAVWSKPIIDTIEDHRKCDTPVLGNLGSETNSVTVGTNTFSSLLTNVITIRITNVVGQAGTDPILNHKRISVRNKVGQIFRQIGPWALLQGCLTLIVIVCLWWWYGVFLRTFSPAEGFTMYLYDFVSLGVFSVAAGIWMDTRGFFAMVVLACMIMIFFRFVLARPKTKQSKGAKQALTLAITIVGVLLLAGIFFNAAFIFGKGTGWTDITKTELNWYLSVAMVASMVVTIHGVLTTEGWGWGRRFILNPDTTVNHLIDPSLGVLRKGRVAEPATIESQCQRSRWEFEQKCEEYGLHRYGQISSAVHSSHDLNCQAKLAFYAANSCSEARMRIQVMYFVHWFDDVMDQREKLAKELLKQKTLNYETIFPDQSLWKQFISLFRDSLTHRHHDLAEYYHGWFKGNSQSFEMGLVRLIYGGRLFKESKESEINRLREKHKGILLGQGVSQNLIDRYSDKYIDLTVKTVMEFWFGMESGQNMNYAFHYSLLYGPALYYHDDHAERKAGELHKNWSLNEDETAKMIRDIGERIESQISGDPKAQGRAQEVSHFVLCFSNVLPASVKEAYDEVADRLLRRTDSSLPIDGQSQNLQTGVKTPLQGGRNNEELKKTDSTEISLVP